MNIRSCFSTALGLAGFVLVLLLAHPADAQSSLPAAPAEWVYTAIPTVTNSNYPSLSGYPSIVVPAVSGAQHVVD